MSDAKTHSFEVDGTNISLAFPKHHTAHPGESKTPKKQYQIDETRLRNIVGDKRGWDYRGVVLHDWDFYGPVFGGDLATLSFTVGITAPYKLDEGVSSFHPRSFEYILADLLTFRFGHEFLDDFSHGGKQAWRAPENWAPVTRFESVCARYDVLPSTGRHLEYHRMTLPISDTHLLDLRFTSSWNPQPGDDLGSRDWLDRSAIHQLINGICDSLQVELSPKAKAQRDRALQGLDNTSLVDSYPPLKWTKAVPHGQEQNNNESTTSLISPASGG